MKNKEKFVVNSLRSRDEFIKRVESMFPKNPYLTFSVVNGRPRSLRQNRALHVYFQLLADAFNDAGYDMRKTLREDVEIPWSAEAVKEHIWRPVQSSMIGKSSTTEAKSDEYTRVYDVINRHTAQKLGISVPFPANENDLKWRK